MSARPAATRGHLQLIEAARGLAALAVVLYHAGRLMAPPQYAGHVGLSDLFGLGFLGVDFFFLLSGFLILFVHQGDVGRPGQLPRYLWRRFARIFPTYWLMLAIEATVRLVLKPELLAATGADGFARQSMLALPASALWIGPAWSLQFELFFYLVFALFIVNRWLGLVAFAGWFGAVLIGYGGAALPDLGWIGRGVVYHGYSLYFPLGMLIGWTARRRPADLRWLAIALGAVAAACTLASRGSIGLDFSLLRFVFIGTGLGALLALIVRIDQRGIPVPAPLRLLGSASYSLYLSHVFVISHAYALLTRLGLFARLPEPLIYLGAVVGALVFALLLYHVFERPVLARLRRLGRTKTMA